MAVLLQLRESESIYLARVLAGDCAYCAAYPDLRSLHARFLDFLRAVCDGRPLVIDDIGCRYLIDGIARQEQAHGRAPEARSILARLMPNVGAGASA